MHPPDGLILLAQLHHPIHLPAHKPDKMVHLIIIACLPERIVNNSQEKQIKKKNLKYLMIAIHLI
jgi:hypothetical protein